MKFYSVTRPQFFHSTVDRHYGCFRFLTITNTAAMNILHVSAYLKHLIELQSLSSASENSNSTAMKMAEVQGMHMSNFSR